MKNEKFNRKIIEPQLYLKFQSEIAMNYIKTWKEVMLRPSDFFRRMQTAEGYTDPLIFALISIILNVFFFTLFRDGMLRFGFQPSILTSSTMQDSGSNFIIFSNIIEPFIICIQCAFIMAQAFNLASKALGGTGNYNSTVNFMLYTNAPAVLAWIPILNFIAGIYYVYLNIVGGMIVHNVSMRKSIAILLLSVILFILLLALLVIFILCIYSAYEKYAY